MSGGGGGMGGAGGFSDAGYANRRATGYSTAGMRRSGMNRQANHAAALPGRTSSPSGLGGSTANGEPRIAAVGVEPARVLPPTSKGPSGIDTGGAGTDPASMLARSAAARRRSRFARGGGLSNVRFGGDTLG